MRRCMPSSAIQWVRLCRSTARSHQSISYSNHARPLLSKTREPDFNRYSTASGSEITSEKLPESTHPTTTKVRQHPIRLVRKLLAAHHSKYLPSTAVDAGLGRSVLPANDDYNTSAIKLPVWVQVNVGEVARVDRVTLPSVLASCISHALMKNSLAEASSGSYSEWNPTAKEIWYLKRHRALQTDVQKWTRVLLATDPATIETEILSEPISMSPGSRSLSLPIPHWIAHLYLDQPSVFPKALAIFYQYFQRIINYKKRHMWLEADDSRLLDFQQPLVADERLILGCTFRLIHHARRMWPEMIVAVSDLALQILSRMMAVELHRIKTKPRIAGLQRLTRHYNFLLKILSRPSTVTPFHATKFQQKAQFNVLRAVQSHDNLLTINREGYRAIISVQLSTLKTAQERDWSQLKAKSWPPFKQDRTGLDAEKDKEYGTSRALQAIQQAAQAGYTPLEWEKAAQILSGWDVDGSPTIQTRAMLPHLKSKENTWAARVTATRTAHEAWAMFLAYEGSGQPAAVSVYMAVLVKLVHALRGSAADVPSNMRYFADAPSERRSLEAGDMIEPPPNSEPPRDTPYMSRALPSFDELANLMYEKCPRLPNSAIAFLVAEAASLENGVKYLEWGMQRVPGIKYLFDRERMTHDHLACIPINIFSGFIRLLCRFSLCRFRPELLKIPETGKPLCPDAEKLPLAIRRQERGWELARQLLLIRAPRYKPPWHQFILTCAKLTVLSQRIPELESRLGRVSQAAFHAEEAFSHMRQLGLPIDIEMFRLGCLSTEKYMISCVLHHISLKESAEPTESDAIPGTIDVSKILVTKARQVIDMFNELFGTPSLGAPPATSHNIWSDSSPTTDGNDNVQIPPLLATPSAASLHAFIRTIGISADDQSIVNFARWMARYHREVLAATEMPRNGPVMLRRVLVAIRVFLERSWIPTLRQATQAVQALYGPLPDASSTEPSSTAMLVASARESIEEIEGFGGWPTDEEVDAYVKAWAFSWN